MQPLPTQATPLSTALLPARQDKTGTKLASPQQGEADLNSSQATALARGQDALSRRVAGLSDAMGDMAQQLAQQFAGQLLGDGAEGARIEFDKSSLATRSSFTAAAYSQTDANGTSRAAGFRLDDASQFLGHGYITTRDGRRFEFEMEIRYESSQQAVAAERSSSQPNASQPAQAATASPSRPAPFATDFAGTAADLLDRLTSEPVRLPFALQQADEQQPSLLGDLALRLLDLPGGSRYLDLRPDDQGQAGRLDLHA